MSCQSLSRASTARGCKTVTEQMPKAATASLQLPGRGVVGVRAILDAYPGGQGYSEIEEADDRNSFARLNGAISPSEKWPTAMAEVQVDPAVSESVVDFALDPGQTVTLRTLDPQGNPLKGVEVTGVTEINGAYKKMDAAEFDLICFRPGENRTVLLSHPTLRFGKALRIKQAMAADGPLQVTLEPMAVVTGQLTIEDAPVSGAALRIHVHGDKDYGRSLRGAATGSDGRFRHDEFLPGLDYSIYAEGRGLNFTVVAKQLSVAPGETVDLGTIDVTTDERPEPVRSPAAAVEPVRPAGNQATSVETRQAASAPAETAETKWVSGQIKLPSGEPVAGRRSRRDRDAANAPSRRRLLSLRRSPCGRRHG